MMGLLVLSGTSMALDDSSYEETFARSYTTTIMHYPSLCQTDEFAKSCTYFTNYYVGKFTYPDYEGEIEWQPQYVGSGQGKHNVFLSENGELQVLGAGSLDVVAYDKNTWKKLAAFTITVSDIQAEKLRLVPAGKYVKET